MDGNYIQLHVKLNVSSLTKYHARGSRKKTPIFPAINRVNEGRERLFAASIRRLERDGAAVVETAGVPRAAMLVSFPGDPAAL
ncbi:MAG TPA: hypothetical protein VHK24_05155, partial [Steroidobacter sp.]|nr:hypothetical protein [Steroidobacter sp.]